MAKHSSHVLDIARKGAEHKYAALKAELATLIENFPHLAATTGKRVSRATAAAFAQGRTVVGNAIAGNAKPSKRHRPAKARKATGSKAKRATQTRTLAAKR